MPTSQFLWVTFHYFYLCFLCWFIGLYSKKVKTIWDRTYCETRKKCHFKLGFQAKENFWEKMLNFCSYFFREIFAFLISRKFLHFVQANKMRKNAKFSRKLQNFLETIYFFRWKPYFKQKFSEK